jgi:uncharacterized protein YeaO (DUF488 family)
MLVTKCILLPPSAEDGVRISIMSRHTLADGKTPDERISASSFFLWWRKLAPPPKAVGAYYRKEIGWSRFERLYAEHLGTPEIVTELKCLAKLASTTNVTVMCVEEDCRKCHRRLLAEHLHALYPEVEIRLDL